MFGPLWIGRRREAAAADGCRNWPALHFWHRWISTVGAGCHINSIYSVSKCSLCLLSFCPSSSSSIILSFFFLSFFCCCCCCCCHCLCIYPPSVHTSPLFTPLSLHTVLLLLFVKAQFMASSRSRFMPTDATQSE